MDFKIIFVLIYINQFIKIDGLNVAITNVQICTGSNYTITGKCDIKNGTESQIISGTATLLEDIGNNNKYSCKLFTIVGNKRKLLGNLEGKGVCKALLTYGGQMWIRVAKIVNIPNPSKCPIVKNTYTLNDFLVNYAEISIFPLVPNGKYYATCTLYDARRKNILGCCSGEGYKFV